MLGQRPTGELLVDPKGRVLRRALLRHPSRGHRRGQLLDRERLQPPPTPLRARPDPPVALWAPPHHRGRTGRL